MRRRDALKLHNGDEVILKETNEICTVYRSYRLSSDPRIIKVEIQAPASQSFRVVDSSDIT